MLLPRQIAGKDSRKNIKRLVRAVHICVVLGSIFLVYSGLAIPGLALLIVALLVDFVLFKLKVTNKAVGISIKVLLFATCAALILYLFIHHDIGSGNGNGNGGSESEGNLDAHLQSMEHRRYNFPKKRTKAAAAAEAMKPSKERGKKTYRHHATADPLSPPTRHHFPNASYSLLFRIFGAELPASNCPDLKYRPPSEVYDTLSTAFSELPEDGFLNSFKNPCWRGDSTVSRAINEREAAMSKKRRKSLRRKGVKEGDHHGRGRGLERAAAYPSETDGDFSLHCLPYAYVLGQPKCGTSDLFERLKMHHEIRMPDRKEVRWFTRGEFTRSRLDMERPGDGQDQARQRDGGVSPNQLLGPGSSIYSFTKSFQNAVKDIDLHPATHITLDGGPHTFWWPTQSPDGTFLPEAIPTPQIIREMQPAAKFILTLSDPVKRLYSDYYFLDDNLRVHRPGAQGEGGGKSAEQLQDRVAQQIAAFEACVKEGMGTVRAAGNGGSGGSGDAEEEGAKGVAQNDTARGDSKHTQQSEADKIAWFRASQVCAHDRHRFAQAGWGRLAIGLYSLFYEKWLEHFPPSQFLVVRLEDYDVDPKAYMEKIIAFLGLSQPDFSDWGAILNRHRANAYYAYREPIAAATEAALRDFYAPYNKLLGEMLENDAFRWDAPAGSLRAKQLRNAHEQTGEDAPRGGGGGGAEAEAEAEARAGRKKLVVTAARAARHEDVLKRWDKVHDALLGNSNSNSSAPSSERGRLGGGGSGADTGNMDASGAQSSLTPRSEHRNVHGLITDDNDDDYSHEVHVAARKTKKHIIPYRQEGVPDPTAPDGPTRTRHGGLVLVPERFSLDGLALPDSTDFNLWLRDGKYIDRQNPLLDEQDAAEQLCIAAFALDLSALKYLLYEKGVPNTLTNSKDAGRNAFHCLALVHIMADAHGKSQVFALLKGRNTWLTPYLDPPMEKMSRSVLARDIINGTSKAVLRVAAWLTRAGIENDLPDATGNAPLHHAVAGGQSHLARYLVAHGADVHRANREGRTPLHYACSYGHARLAGDLLTAGASLDAEDKFGTTPRAVVAAPGPVMAPDALLLLNVTQRPARTIRRMIHPERQPIAKGGWRAGTGGWGTERLKGYEQNMECEIDQYWAHEITPKQLFEQYISRMAPVLIRGLLDDWEAVHRYAHANLTALHGQLRVQVSDIPYADKFGGQPRKDMLLQEYINEVREHRVVGGSHPWYVFKGNRIPFDSERSDSLVQFDWAPTPGVIQQAIEFINPPTARGYLGPKSREVFINAQWAIGGEGTGAPVHYHNTAWNALIYGAKKWVVYPPHSMIMSNRQILEYFETDFKGFADRGIQSLTCVQTAGDVLIVPEIWGHGVLNLQESVAIATESKANHWRIKPATQLLTKLPSPAVFL